MKTKTFDCVEMKRQGQERLHAILKGMTPDQQMEWWRKRSEEFLRRQNELRKKLPPAAARVMER